MYWGGPLWSYHNSCDAKLVDHGLLLCPHYRSSRLPPSVFWNISLWCILLAIPEAFTSGSKDTINERHIKQHVHGKHVNWVTNLQAKAHQRIDGVGCDSYRAFVS